ncbi:myb/SANT-like DNA-binding domain-containing protein 3 [Dermacentor albipictus]|uniref:myb/SANT-like DNA-binding domain-containing protein 3 n=1 Tax=Dermacentor albipictus TaxID=60249 RepID=UPI0038FC641A
MPGKTYFTEEEKDLVQDLINKYKDVIENKRTDAVSLTAKAKAWEKLCAEYNSRPFVRARDVKQLKKLWDNLKQRWKREKAKQIRDVMATGGGPPPQPIDDRLAQVEAVVPHLTTRVPNPFDSDRPLDAPSDTQSALEILNGMLHDSGPADSDEGNN